MATCITAFCKLCTKGVILLEFAKLNIQGHISTMLVCWNKCKNQSGVKFIHGTFQNILIDLNELHAEVLFCNDCYLKQLSNRIKDRISWFLFELGWGRVSRHCWSNIIDSHTAERAHPQALFVMTSF